MSRQQLTVSPSRAVLRRLADLRAEPDGVLSVYIDLDVSIFPTPRDRQTEINALIEQAEQAFIRRDLAHDERAARVEALERLRSDLDAREVAKDKTRSIAAFLAPTADVFDVLHVGHPVAPTVVADASPYLRPLANEAGPRTWAVLLVDRRRARLLYGGERRLIEVVSFEDNTPSHQKQGGWSAEKYQRHSDEAAADHVALAVDKLFELWEQIQFDALAIAAPDPAYNEAVDALHSYLKERFKGRIDIEVGFTNAEDVLSAAMPLFEETREAAVGELLHRLNEAPRERVALGPAAVFDALFERRVDTLIVEEGYVVAGVHCPECDWLGLQGKECPFDGIAVEDRPDVVDDAIDLALQQAARVVTISTDGEVHASEPISALLRY